VFHFFDFFFILESLSRIRTLRLLFPWILKGSCSMRLIFVNIYINHGSLAEFCEILSLSFPHLCSSFLLRENSAALGIFLTGVVGRKICSLHSMSPSLFSMSSTPGGGGWWVWIYRNEFIACPPLSLHPSKSSVSVLTRGGCCGPRTTYSEQAFSGFYTPELLFPSSWWRF